VYPCAEVAPVLLSSRPSAGGSAYCTIGHHGSQRRRLL